jgi:carboxyl-terminal processing protease
MKRNMLLLAFRVLAGGSIAAILMNCMGLGPFAPQGITPGMRSDFGLMAEAWNTIQRYYVDRSAIQPGRLTYGAISGMVEALGDTGHSTFLTPEMLKREKELTQGKYKGVGIEVRMKGRRVVIVAPFDGSPAQKAGLRPGDVILRVDGEDVTGLALSQVANRILGPEGTTVSLTIMNPATGDLRTVSLIRANITIDNVTWQRLPDSAVAHLRIAAFSRGVSKDLREALVLIQKEEIRGIILDLRNDPGGFLDEAVGSASQFLRSGNVLLEKDAEGKITPVPVQSGGIAPDVPLAVLINGGTASASEIVAGALKDALRATLVGETTFGTGTVLSQFRLSDGSALLLAVKEWLTPDGSTIWHTGITPNISVALPPGVVPSVPQTEQGMTLAALKATHDEQLLRALSLLTRQ